MKLPFTQSLTGIEIVTAVCCPADSVPLAGLKVTPGKLLDAVAVHVNCPWELEDSDRVSVHVQPLVESPGQLDVLTVTVKVGGEQLQLNGMLLAGPETVIVALAGQSISAIATVAVVVCPGGREPLDGVIVIPLTPLPEALHGQSTWLLAAAAIVKGQLQPEPAA